LALELALLDTLTTRAEDLEALALEFDALETFLATLLDCFCVLDLLASEVLAKAMGEVNRVIEAARISETQIFLLNTIILVLF
jgi:hypothetical protein